MTKKLWINNPKDVESEKADMGELYLFLTTRHVHEKPVLQSFENTTLSKQQHLNLQPRQ